MWIIISETFSMVDILNLSLPFLYRDRVYVVQEVWNLLDIVTFFCSCPRWIPGLCVCQPSATELGLQSRPQTCDSPASLPMNMSPFGEKNCIIWECGWLCATPHTCGNHRVTLRVGFLSTRGSRVLTIKFRSLCLYREGLHPLSHVSEDRVSLYSPSCLLAL
jgi:hypothetical protein